jgi:WD40 repeat protein/serine/threonine protein kinase
MAIAAVADFVDAIQLHGLLDPSQIEKLPDVQAGIDDPRTLAQRLLALDWLTPYQVNYLLQRRGGELVLGSYVLLQRLGEGGTGHVYKARHQAMRRIVALKVIRKELLTDAEVLARFYREIQVASQVAHPHVVHAYDAGPVGDTHFLAMEYVNGIDLSRQVKRSGALSVKQACDYIRQAALGLQHIHEQGLVHRDIKPSNLLLAESPGPQAQANAQPAVGLVKVSDLGLARFQKTLDAEVTATFTPVGGVMMGTPDYMAPEQALDFHRADIRADIYSLGCTLYYLLRGQPPFPGGTLAQKLLWHQQGKPPDLTQIRTGAPQGLSPILERMLEKQPGDRYQTPAELAGDLAAFAAASNDQPTGVAATMGGFADIPPLALPSDPTEVSAAPSGGLSSADSGPDTDPLGFAAQVPPPSDEVRHRQRVRIAWIAAGCIACLLLVPILIRTFTVGHPDKPTDSPVTEFPDSQVNPLTTQPIPSEERFDWQPKELVAVLGEHRLRHWGAGLALGFTPDGKELFSYGGENVVRYWDPTTGRERKTCPGLKGWMLPVVFSADGRFIVTGSKDFTLRKWEITTGKEMAAFKGHSGRHLISNFSRDGNTLASAALDGTIRLWDVPTATQRAIFARDPQSNVSLMSPDGKTVAYGGGNFSIRLWDVASNKDRAAMPGHQHNLIIFAFSADSRMLASGSLDQTVRLWDVATGKQRHVLQGHAVGISALNFSPDGETLASGAFDGHIKLWDVASGKERADQKAHLSSIADVAIGPDNQTLASTSIDATVRIWDLPVFKERFSLRGHAASVRLLAFSPDGKTLASTSGDKMVRLWDVADVKERAAFISGAEKRADEGVYTLAFAPAPALTLATANRDGTVRLWDPASGKELRVLFRANRLHAMALAYSPNGKLLAVALSDSTVRLLDAVSGTELTALKGHTGRITSLAFAPDNQLLVSGSGDGTVRVWDMPVGTEHRVIPAKVDNLTALAFSPDGKTLAWGGGDDRFVHLWDAVQQQELPSLSAHAGRVTSLAFAPGGARLVSAGQDGRIIVWNHQSHTKLREWLLPGIVHNVAFTPDGHHLATANSNSTIYILQLTPPTTK